MDLTIDKLPRPCYTYIMYIKKVTKTNGKTKKKYTYLHLVESVRTEQGPRQRLILNLGDLPVHPSQHKALARRIEDILTGTKSMFDLDPEIEAHARKAADKIFAKRAEQINNEEAHEFRMVDTKSFQVSQPRSLGAEYVCHAMWKTLGFDTILTRCGVPKTTLPILEALVVGRMIEPGSERWTKQWAEECSGLYELTGMPLRHSLQSYYRGSDTLERNKEELEQHLSQCEEMLFELEERVVLYDLTNTYFEGRCRRNPKAKFGKSKEKRSDCRLATLGLVVDGEGFAKHSKICPGNQHEAATFQQMVRELEKQAQKRDKATVVMDAGIATEENVTWLEEQGYTYIVVQRGKRPFEIDDEQMYTLKEDEKKGVKIEVKRYEQEGMVYLVVKSEQKRVKEESIATRVEQLLLEQLERCRSGLTQRNRTKKYSKVVEKVGRLKERYASAAKPYDITVIPGKGKNEEEVNAIDIRWERKAGRSEESEKMEGRYVLRSNLNSFSDKQIWETYRMLGNIEAAFKGMKSHLGLRQNFHQKGERVDAHMFISVLAYHLMHAIEHTLRRAGDTRSWWTIKNILRTHERMTIEYISKEEDGSLSHNSLRLNSRLEVKHLEIYTKLGLSGKPLGRRVLKRKIRSDDFQSQHPQRE